MRILFVAPRFPDPLLSGYQVRAFHQLRLLSRRHRISLVCFRSQRPDPQAYATVAGFCDEIHSVPLRPLDRLVGLVRGAVRGLPLQAAVFDTSSLRRKIRELLSQQRHDLVHLQLLRIAPALGGSSPLPRVIDLVDALSLNMARRSRLDGGLGGWAAALETGRLRRYEAQVCQTWDHATVVSETDRRAIGDFPRLSINPNGVDLEHFRPSTAERAPHEIVFTGNLGYFPNIDGISWFAREVLPRLRQSEPRLRLTVVGARPSSQVRRLEVPGAGVSVAGFVPEIVPFLHRARVAVAPLRAGSGQLFKVLEAMACGTPLVATPIAASGIGAVHERHLLLAETAEDFARAVLRLLRDPPLAAGLVAEARQLVEQRFRWETTVEQLEAVYHSLLQPGD
jgi:sugar transferase (PEP-CTERM/EpsH1 system associated)